MPAPVRAVRVITHEKISPWQRPLSILATIGLVLGVVITFFVIVGAGIALTTGTSGQLALVCSGFGPGIMAMISGGLGVVGFRGTGPSRNVMVTGHFVTCFIASVADFIEFLVCLTVLGILNVFKRISSDFYDSKALTAIAWFILLTLALHYLCVELSMFFICCCCACCCGQPTTTARVVYVQNPRVGVNSGVATLGIRSVQVATAVHKVPPNVVQAPIVRQSPPVQNRRGRQMQGHPPIGQFSTPQYSSTSHPQYRPAQAPMRSV